MAKKKTKPVTTDEFRQMEREVGEAASANAKDCWRQQAEEAAEKTRRRALANRTMRQIVEAMMAPPEAVMIPTDFAAALGVRSCVVPQADQASAHGRGDGGSGGRHGRPDGAQPPAPTGGEGSVGPA